MRQMPEICRWRRIEIRTAFAPSAPLQRERQPNQTQPARRVGPIRHKQGQIGATAAAATNRRSRGEVGDGEAWSAEGVRDLLCRGRRR